MYVWVYLLQDEGACFPARVWRCICELVNYWCQEYQHTELQFFIDWHFYVRIYSTNFRLWFFLLVTANLEENKKNVTNRGYDVSCRFSDSQHKRKHAKCNQTKLSFAFSCWRRYLKSRLPACMKFRLWRLILVTDVWHACHLAKTKVNLSVLFLVTNLVHWHPPFVLLSLSVLVVFIKLDTSKDTETHKWR